MGEMAPNIPPSQNRWIFLLPLLILIALAIPAIQLALFSVYPVDPQFSGTKIIEVRRGQSPTEITKSLVSQGVIQDERSFLWLGKLTRQWKKIKAGEYTMSPAQSPRQIFSIITSGISTPHPVTVREGENIYEIADDILGKGLGDRTKFVQLCQDPTFIRSLSPFKDTPPISLEGYLYPETYYFNRTLTEADMIKQMVRHFFEFWTPELEKRAKEMGMDRHQVVTLASIIEKETGAPEERPLISSVFHNRLTLKMRLQSDPTTIYGIWNQYRGNIHKQDLLSATPYNTYYVSALPVGPISNPGKEAIRAALFPAQSKFLFFVSHNDGTHQFSQTVAEHNRAVNQFQRNPRAREGKSWRDLGQKKPPTPKGG